MWTLRKRSKFDSPQPKLEPCYNPKKKGGAAFKYWNYKKRWEEQIAHGGSKFEKYREIDRYVFHEFQKA